MAVQKKAMTVGDGKLYFGESSSGLDFSAEVLEAKIVPSAKAGNTIKLLSGDYMAEPTEYTYKLSASVIQNLTLQGVVGYLMKNAGSIEKITFIPSNLDGAKFVGNVRLDPTEMGGKVGSTEPVKLELDFIGDPVFTAATKAGGLT